MSTIPSPSTRTGSELLTSLRKSFNYIAAVSRRIYLPRGTRKYATYFRRVVAGFPIFRRWLPTTTAGCWVLQATTIIRTHHIHTQKPIEYSKRIWSWLLYVRLAQEYATTLTKWRLTKIFLTSDRSGSIYLSTSRSSRSSRSSTSYPAIMICTPDISWSVYLSTVNHLDHL